MSASAAKASSSLVKASLSTPEQAKGFLAPLSDLLKSGVSKMVINFSDTEGIYINGLNDICNAVCKVNYTEEFAKQFRIESDYALGVYELSEFISLASVFKDQMDFEIASNNAVEVKDENIVFNFLGSDIDAIKQGPARLTAKLTWFAEFKWESAEMSRFVNGMSRLSQGYLKFEGKAGDNSLSITVCDKDIKTSTISMHIDLEDELESDFKMVFRKDIILPVINGSIKDLNVQISNKLIVFAGGNDSYDVKYQIACVDVN